MCAVRGRPGGGPVDKTPPEILFTHPRPDSTRIENLESIEIYFSERMDEASVEQSIFISPPLNYETDWSGGEELSLKLLDSLVIDKTYVVTVGSGAMDSRKNKLKESVQFAFATGDKINDAKITGKVFGITPQDNFYIYAYQMINPDSLDPTQNKANFLSQPGEDGSFLLNYLSYGEYRVFVIEDLNKNLILDSDFERIGIPSTDIYLDSINLAAENLNFKITRMDSTPPTVIGARPLDNKKILLRISEPVESLLPHMVTITDTLFTDTLEILALAQNIEESNQYFLYTEQQKSEEYYQVSVSALSDTSGNHQSETQRALFMGSTLDDTTRFELVTLAPEDSTKNLPLSGKINIQLSLPIDTLSLYNSFFCILGDSDTLAGIWQWENLMNGFYNPISEFQPSQEYVFVIESGTVNSLWGDTLSDTTISRRVFVTSEDEFGSLSGQLSAHGSLSHKAYINIIPLDRKIPPQKILVNEQNFFQVVWLPEGQYQIGAFLDLDDNTKYSAGRLIPFQYSEPFTVKEDTIRIRKRWEVANISISIPGVN
jgi:hypothetical protein